MRRYLITSSVRETGANHDARDEYQNRLVVGRCVRASQCGGARRGLVMAEERACVSPSSIELAESRARDEELGRDDDDADDDDDGYEENAPLVVKRSEVAAADAAESAPSSSSRGELTRGMLLYALGVACASITALTARLMHDLGVPVHWVVLLRACAGVTMVSSLMARRWSRGLLPRPLGRRHALLCVRALLGMLTIYAFFCTASYIPLADAAVPTFVAPLVTVAGAAVALGERPPRTAWIAFPVCLLGALLVVQPTFAFGRGARHLPAIGVLSAAAQAILGGCSKIMIRVLSGGIAGVGAAATPGAVEKEHPLTMLWYTSVACVLGMGVIAAATPGMTPAVVSAAKVAPATLTALWVASSASGFVAQMCVTTALGMAPASAMSPIHYTAVVWATSWGAMLGEVPGVVESLGIAMVVAGSAAATAASAGKTS